jgi:hypothetical protein
VLLSGHTADVCGSELLIFGGYQQTDNDNSVHSDTISRYYYIFDIPSATIDQKTIPPGFS